MSDPFTLDQIVELMDPEPPLGAVIVLQWMKASRVFKVYPSELNEDGWKFLQGFMGEEAVQIAQSHMDQLVLFVPCGFLDEIPTERRTDYPTLMALTGPRVYEIEEAPTPPLYSGELHFDKESPA